MGEAELVDGVDLDSLQSQIAEMKTQMKREGEACEKENKAFQMTVADQRATKVAAGRFG